MGFAVQNGYLRCDDVRVADVIARVGETPFFLYSLDRLRRNYRAYADAFGDTAVVAYALKANGNLTLLGQLRDLGSGAVLVSGGELLLAQRAGFDPKRTVLNGNGKTPAELEAAVRAGVLVNIDSEFDLVHLREATARTGQPVEVLLRVNPDLDPKVHPYVSTGVRESKFGVAGDRLDWFLDEIRKAPALRLAGVHCHLGSTIDDVGVFRDAAVRMVEHVGAIRAAGFSPSVINIGGGLGIDGAASPADLAAAVRGVIPDGVALIIEPGRSIVGDAGILVGRVIGVKKTASKRFIVTDASMTELIRPSLYGAHHRIGFAAPVEGPRETFDVVGPVCESADFLGRDRELPTPPEGTGLVVYDAGAYGYAMSSNYNARPRPAEYLIDGKQLRRIRRAEPTDDLLRLFCDEPVLL